jgi:hypothetical protein
VHETCFIYFFPFIVAAAMADDLETRLQSHARAFEGLMSLIPAKEYYGKDSSVTSEQWRKTKKQTREERQNAKRAKLDPASHKTAKDVMDENDRKRKRELEGDDSSELDMDIEKEKPFEGMKGPAKPKKAKLTEQPKPKGATEENAVDIASVKAKARAEKRKQKQEKKKEMVAKKQQKLAEKKSEGKKAAVELSLEEAAVTPHQDEEENMDVDAQDETEKIEVDISDLVDDNQSTATPSADSAGTAASVVSNASSASSIVPPVSADAAPKPDKENKSKFLSLPQEEREAIQARFAARVRELRAARKADGPDGRPARNRAELIEARRKKQQAHKAAQKANREVAKEDEARLKAEAELARLRGSGSPYSMSGVIERNSPVNDLAFGRIAWRDGQQMDTKLSGLLDSNRRKGPSDPKTALQAAEKKWAHINSLDEQKRKDIAEKELWLSAKKRAQGEKVHDDVALLRKSVKRTEKAKAKSKKEWKERITNIDKGKEIKQKKREGNLKKRREESKKGGGVKKGKKPVKKVKRAGFEGTFKGR